SKAAVVHTIVGRGSTGGSNRDVQQAGGGPAVVNPHGIGVAARILHGQGAQLGTACTHDSACVIKVAAGKGNLGDIFSRSLYVHVLLHRYLLGEGSWSDPDEVTVGGGV